MRLFALMLIGLIGVLCIPAQDAEAGYPDGMNTYAYYAGARGGVDPTGMWKIDRNGGDLASAVAEKDDTIDTLATSVGLDSADFQKWVTLNGKIKVEPSNPVALQGLKTTDKICEGEKVEIPNVALVYWAGEVGGVGKQWAGYNDDRAALKRRGFKVDEQSGMTAANLTTHISTAMQNKTLHGMYYWGHGFDAVQGTCSFGTITDHYAHKKSAKAWKRYANKLTKWFTNGQNGARPAAPSIPRPSEYSLEWQDIKPSYKFGFVIINTCFANNPDAQALVSGNGIFHGAANKTLYPTPFFLGRDSVSGIISPGDQGTKK